LDESELIIRAKQGDKEALNELISRNIDILKGYVYKLTFDIHLTQDIVQETLIKAVINLDKFVPKAKFSTWLIKIATNTYKDYLRRYKPSENLFDFIEDENQNVENIVLSKENYNKVIKILKSLSAKQRMVFILKHFYGYKYDEISKIMHCPIGTVRSCLHNAIGNIIKQLEKEGMYDE